MTKSQVIQRLNDAIDKLILSGLDSEKNKAKFRELCRYHKQLVISK